VFLQDLARAQALEGAVGDYLSTRMIKIEFQDEDALDLDDWGGDSDADTMIIDEEDFE
jgi:hypothetical protein